MKEFKNYLLAIGMHDYVVDITTDNKYNVINIIAKENIKEGKKCYNKGNEIKLNKSDLKFIKENLIEENEPFPECD